MNVLATMTVRHSTHCAVHDPSPGACDCGARDIALVSLADAKMAVAAERVKLYSLLSDAARWLHAAYDRPPQSTECREMLARIDAMLTHLRNRLS